MLNISADFHYVLQMEIVMTKKYIVRSFLLLTTLAVASHASSPAKKKPCDTYEIPHLLSCNVTLAPDVLVQYEIKTGTSYVETNRNGRCTGKYQQKPLNATIEIYIQGLNLKTNNVRFENTLIQNIVIDADSYKLVLGDIDADFSSKKYSLDFKSCSLAVPSGISVGN